MDPKVVTRFYLNLAKQVTGSENSHDVLQGYFR